MVNKKTSFYESYCEDALLRVIHLFASKAEFFCLAKIKLGKVFDTKCL